MSSELREFLNDYCKCPGHIENDGELGYEEYVAILQSRLNL